MAVGPNMAFVFLLRPGMSEAGALEKVVEALRRYRGFHLEDHDTDPEELWAAFDHLGFEFRVESLDNIFGEKTEVPHPPLLVLSADSDLMMDDQGEMDPEFWKAWQNAIALIVAEVNPWCGFFTDTDSLSAFTHKGVPKEPIHHGKETWILEYFSNNYLKAAFPDQEEAIRAFATRELAHGPLVATYLLPEGRRQKLDAILIRRG